MKSIQLFKYLFVTFAFALMTPKFANAQVTINSTNFPDDNFRKFLLAQSYGKDGVITESEIKGINMMEIIGYNIRNLKGIEYFKAMTVFRYHSNGYLPKANLSKNAKLQFVHFYYLDVPSPNPMNDIIASLPKNTTSEDHVFNVGDYSDLNKTQISNIWARGWTPTYGMMYTKYPGEPKPDPKPVPVTKITLNASSATLKVDEEYQLAATVSPSNATDKSVKWSSDNTKVATVSDKGKVKATGKGSAVITCTAKDGSKVSATCKVTVEAKSVPVTKITLNASSATLKVDEEYQLAATVSPSNATDKSVKWSSNNTKVATVDKGKVKATGKGNAVITCTANDGSKVSATCNVKVESPIPDPVPVTDITLNASSATLKVGEEYQLSATVSPSNATDKSVIWSSNNRSVAEVSETGLVTAISEGTVTITCLANDGSSVFSTCTIIVEDSLDAINGTQVNDIPSIIFNLNGQQLSKPRKGINIINGKKVVIK
jgi:uncharacterized protein YjdB